MRKSNWYFIEIYHKMKNTPMVIPVAVLMAILCSSCILIFDGKWDDNIKLSDKSVEFGSAADSTIITTQGTTWWIVGISVNDTNYYGWNINPQSTSYTIREDCVTVSRRDAHTLFLKLEANRTGYHRTVRISLEAGDYFDSVTINQKSR
jgi:hypothetical protein